MANLKGFIKNSQGDIILPISRGELIFDAAGNIALHSEVFKAEAGRRYTQEEINNAQPGDPAYGQTIKVFKTGTGKYGLMTPEDLLDLHEALVRISNIERETGVGEGGSEESLKQILQDLIEKVGYYQGEIIGTDDEGNPIVKTENSGIYEYVNNRIVNHLAQSDALKFKGTLGQGGNTTVLPTEGINNGDTYKVISNGVYGGKSAKVGDLLIALYTPGINGAPGNYSWDLVPSGNEQETFIKVQQNLGTEKIDKILSGTVEFTGGNGVSIQYVETTDAQGNVISGKVVITGNGQQTSIELTDLKTRVTDLENKINGTQAYTDDQGVLHPAVPGLISKTTYLLQQVSDAVTSLEQVLEKEVDENGQPTDTLKNGDKLVKTSALYDVAVQLAQHITSAETKYLQAETMALTTALSSAQKNYLVGAIIN